MMKSADDRRLDDLAQLGPLYRTWLGRILVQRKMRAAAVAMVEDVATEQPPQGALVPHYDVIQQHTPQRPDHALHVRLSAEHGKLVPQPAHWSR